VVPPGPYTEERQDLGHIIALGSHVGGAPYDDPHCSRHLTGLVHMAFDETVGEGPADVPGEGAGHRLGVDRVEVATRRQHVGTASGGGAAGPRGDVASIEAGE